MSTRDQVLEILLDVVPDIEPESMSPDTNFREAFNVDSMDFVDILERVATELGVEVPERDYPQVVTLAGLASYVDARKAG
ncbi:MAG: acyl carrier protein [Actinobacteria bacterium]|nr:acyl carrier protein [Actinomycetota bacterium]